MKVKVKVGLNQSINQPMFSFFDETVTNVPQKMSIRTDITTKFGEDTI